VANLLQYPLERHGDLQRRWERLLQRTATPKVGHSEIQNQLLSLLGDRPRPTRGVTSPIATASPDKVATG
jgi:hypothetical protein